MKLAEVFTKEYPSLTTGSQRFLETGLTGHEQVIGLGFAMTERLKAMAKMVKMQFLAAALVDHDILRLYFRSADSLHIKDVRRISQDPAHDLLLDIAIHKFKSDGSDWTLWSKSL